MPWVKLDDGFDEHHAIAPLSGEAVKLLVFSMTYCGRNLTDGFVPEHKAIRLSNTARQKHIDELVAAGRWDVVEGGYQIPSFLDYNPSKAKVMDDRGYNARRQAMHKDTGLRDRIKARDKSMCRYCGIVVKWSDRKGPTGGTYDHIVPRGPNTEENLVVACRGCNSSKADRSLEEWGRPLRPEPRSDLDRGPRSGSGSFQQTRPAPTRSNQSVTNFDPDVDRPVEEPASLEVVKDNIATARTSLRPGKAS